MAYVLDAGALIAADRRDQRLVALLAVAAAERQPIRVPSAAVAQAWRGGGRQAALSRLLDSATEIALDRTRSRQVGELLGASPSSDAVDASVINVAHPGDIILTSDPVDIALLASACNARVRVVRV